MQRYSKKSEGCIPFFAAFAEVQMNIPPLVCLNSTLEYPLQGTPHFPHHILAELNWECYSEEEVN